MRIPLLTLIIVACTHPSGAAEPAPHPNSDDIVYKHSHVGILAASGGRYVLDVEVAATDPQRERGLMFRRSLADNAGMIFLFDEDSVHQFWMKNTLIPLDMLFINSDGVVIGIVADATPETTTPRAVEKPSRYVLEVNGGWAALKGVHAGDRVDVSAALTVR